MIKAGSSIKQIVFFVEGVDLTQNTYKLDSFTNLSKTLKEGSSVILVDRKPKVAELSPLISLLWFDETLSQGLDFQSKFEINQLRIFDSSKSPTQDKSSSNDDEENTEVKFLRNPNKMSEISDAKVFILTQSESIAKFAETSEINYVYEKNSNVPFESWIEEATTKLKGLDLAILHFEMKYRPPESVLPTLSLLDSLVGKYCETSTLKIIYSLFAESVSPSEVIGIHRQQLKNIDSEVRDLVEKIIPRQSWEYTKGEVNQTLVEDKENLRFCLCNYYTKINRTDKITSFEMFTDQTNWRKIGGNIIWIAGLLREIMFELGKFPKFGA